MAERSRVKFNPGTKEIEVEGSESFVKATLDKLQAMLSGAPKAAVKEPKVKKGRPAKKTIKAPKPKAVKATPAKKAAKKPKVVKAKQVRKAKTMAKAAKPATAKRVKKSGKKRGALSKAVLDLINGSAEGVSMAELKEKTGLKDVQIRNVISDATKRGKIRTVKRGVYVGTAETKE